MQQFPIDNNDRPLIPKGKEIPGFKHLKNPMPEGVKLPKFNSWKKFFCTGLPTVTIPTLMKRELWAYCTIPAK
jgi:hypothetical protein